MTRRTCRSLIALPVLAGILAGCGDDITFPPEFDDSLGIDLATMTKTASGLYYQDLVVGTGPVAKAGDSVTVAYTLWLPDGKMLDSGVYPFTLGRGEAIPGFDEGIRGMSVGGKRKLVIHPDLGYGSAGQGGIGPNQTLVFQVELQEIG